MYQVYNTSSLLEIAPMQDRIEMNSGLWCIGHVSIRDRRRKERRKIKENGFSDILRRRIMKVGEKIE